MKKKYSIKLCKGGVCVPYYLCDDVTSNKTDGNLLDIGNHVECLDYLDVCCATGKLITGCLLNSKKKL